MTLVRKLCAIGFVVAIAACASAPPAASESATWDQAKVTGMAKELAAAGNAYWQSLRDQPESDVLGSGEATDFDAMLRKSRVISEQSEGLAGNLAGGKGHDETRDMYRSLKEISDDMAVDVQRAQLDQPAQDAWTKFVGLMDQLAPYYGTRDVAP